MKYAITAIALAALLPLAACGGDGGGTGSVDQGAGRQPEPVTIPSLTGMAAPAETVADQRARAPDIMIRADHLSLTTIHGNTNLTSLPTFAAVPEGCANASCMATIPDPFNEEVEFIPHNLEFFYEGDVGDVVTNDAVGTKNGITLVKSSYVDTSDSPFENLIYGAWMTHGAFGLLTIDNEDEGISVTARWALAAGDLTGSVPTGTATWRGIMVGTPATGSHRGERLQGDATLSYDLSPSRLDVAFANIKDLEHLTAHSVQTVSFNGVNVTADGTFAGGLTGNRIQGGFYGPNHAEAAGIFEKSDIVGAFGAKRQ